MSRRLLFCAVLALAVPLAGCTAADEPPPTPPPATRGGPMQLVAFDSCEQLFTDLRKAAKANVGPYGLPGSSPPFWGRGTRAMPEGAVSAADRAAPAPAFSGTNVHEQGADEPDLIKTDGRRIVTVADGVLRVIDVATRKQTGKLDLDTGGGGGLQLLLAGDSALVLVPSSYSRHMLTDQPLPNYESMQIVLVNLAGAPSVVSRHSGAGSLIDARMTGTTARIVVRRTVPIAFPLDYGRPDDKKRIAANRAAIDKTPDAAWLPSWSLTDSTGTKQVTTDCRKVSRPTDYSGGSMVSVLTFDLSRPILGSGDPVAVAADGDTVYATPDSLYLASDDRWRYDLFPGRRRDRVRERTEFFKFALAGNQPPVYRASGTVPGYLLNQYAMSEWDGHLRVATTDFATERSAVRVLADRDGRLVQTGVVDGLGKGERIYSVRYVGARGYVVTFKQTDPLYSLDLRDPAKPTVTGELKITGYSAHLQPVGPDRLVGIGQEADRNGRTQGLQVSLFDVADPAHPKRLAQYHLPDAYSDAEYDPHALLWWPATNLLVLPVQSGGALALRVTDDVTLAARLDQPALLRSLVVGTELWTLSDAGLRASDLSTMDQLAWVPLAG